MGSLYFADLFSGAGGLSVGLEQAGFNSIFALDNDKSSVETYKKNHPNCDVILNNIEDVSPKELSKKIKYKLFLLAGGPPCQGFSTANRQNKFIEDPRNKLYKYFIDAVAEVSVGVAGKLAVSIASEFVVTAMQTISKANCLFIIRASCFIRTTT